MSVQATTWVWEQSEASGNQRLVLLAIADAANREGEESCQSLDTLARMAKVSKSTVQRALRALTDAGELEATGTSGRYKTTIYRLPKMAPDGGSRADQGSQNDHSQNDQGGQIDPPRVVTAMTTYPTTNPTTSSLSSTSSSTSVEEEGEQEVSSARQAHPEPRPLPEDWRPRWKPDQHTWDWAVTRIEPYGVSLVEVAESMILWARERGQAPSNSLYRTFLTTARDRAIEIENKLDRWETPKDTRDGWAKTYNVAQ